MAWRKKEPSSHLTQREDLFIELGNDTSAVKASLFKESCGAGGPWRTFISESWLTGIGYRAGAEQ